VSPLRGSARAGGRSVACACLVTVCILFVVPVARGEISFVNMFRSASLTQTGDGATLASNGYFFASSLFSTGANDFNAVQLTYPGPGSPVSLAQSSPTIFAYQTANVPNQAALDAQFPTGTYAFSATGPGGPDSTSFNYSTDLYPQSQPFLTGTDYSALQGMDATAPFTVHFSPFVTGSGANESFIFFTIRDQATNMLVFDAGFQPATTTSRTLPANTLAPGHTYTYEVIFSNRVGVPSPGANFDAQIGFDFRTTGTFTSVPEPFGILPAILLPTVFVRPTHRRKLPSRHGR